MLELHCTNDVYSKIFTHTDKLFDNVINVYHLVTN